MIDKPFLICIVGPTGIGKTSLAVEIAKAFGTEIISADSRQFYKEMSIGTAVPSAEELQAVQHHFIQNKSIEENYSVGDFEKDALQLIEKKFNVCGSSKKCFKTLVMVGGSGLYVDAVIRGLDEFPDISSGVREKLNQELKTEGIEFLQKKLAILDSKTFESIDLNNPHRLIRALEVCEATGTPYSKFLNNKKQERNFQTLLIGLTADREKVYERINKRVDQMVEAGLVEEAKKLFPFRDNNALQTVGYRELFQFFEGNISEDEAISEIKKNTRRFAKRQGTWFRKNKEIQWFDNQTNPLEIIAFIKRNTSI